MYHIDIFSLTFTLVSKSIDFVNEMQTFLENVGKFLQLYTEHTAMDENGEDLSGGEMQKLAIIRAVFKDAPFLILDELVIVGSNAEYKIYLLDVTEHQKIKIVNKMVYELCENNDIILALRTS